MKAALVLHQDEGFDEFRRTKPPITLRQRKMLAYELGDIQAVR